MHVIRLSERGRPVRDRWRVAISTMLAVAFVGVTAVPAAAAEPPTTNIITADPCFATFIGVRGTGEAAGSGTQHSGRIYNTGGLGTRLQPLALAFSQDQEIPVREEQLVYPASAFPAFGTSSQLYTNSVATGATNLAAEIQYLVSVCPHVNILLAGYSQGAQVIGNVLEGNVLSSAAKAHITAVALFADPAYNFGEPWDYNYQLGGNGAFHRTKGAFSSYTGSIYANPSDTSPSVQTRVRSYCLANDMWCQSNAGGFNVHANGYTSAVVSPAWAFMKKWMVDTA